MNEFEKNGELTEQSAAVKKPYKHTKLDLDKSSSFKDPFTKIADEIEDIRNESVFKKLCIAADLKNK